MILGRRKVHQSTTCANTFFTNRVVNIWNSLLNDVVLCDTVNKFKSYIDKFWQLFDYKAEIHVTKIRSSHY